MDRFLIIIYGEMSLSYIGDLKDFELFIIDADWDFILVKCTSKTVRRIVGEFPWIKKVEYFDPVPVFWHQWSSDDEDELA